MRSVSVRLDDVDRERLRVVAARAGGSMDAFVRRLVLRYLDVHEPVAGEGAGAQGQAAPSRPEPAPGDTQHRSGVEVPSPAGVTARRGARGPAQAPPSGHVHVWTRHHPTFGVMCSVEGCNERKPR